MNLAHALRFPPGASLALVGAGGKTTAFFQLARQLPVPVLVTATTHLALEQVGLADRHLIATRSTDLAFLEKELTTGVTLVTGSVEGTRTIGLDKDVLQWLHALCKSRSLPLLIEADGSHQLPLKAPADHEPAIPEFVAVVVVVAGLSGLGKPLTEGHVHRSKLFGGLAHAVHGESVTTDMLIRVLAHAQGGLKNIPAGARRVVLLNQADTPELQAQAKMISERLLPAFDAVVSASLRPGSNPESPPAIHAVYEPVAGILLAAGESRRLGRPKQLLPYHGQPFVRVVAETALAAGLTPLVVVTGAYGEEVSQALTGLETTIVHNPNWQDGQSTSIRAGLNALPAETGAAVFLLSDQPQVPSTVLRALIERHSLDLPPIVAPLVDDRRANPVLFDRDTFPALMALTGDTGGRAIFGKFQISYLAWHDADLLIDVDRAEDFDRLVNRNN